MIEAYRIGVNLALSGTLTSDLGKVAGQFDALNTVIRRSQTAINELASGMRALSRVGQGAADSWVRAAAAMERAAQATNKAARSGFSGPGGVSGSVAPSAPAASTALVPWSGGAGPTYGPQGGGSSPSSANGSRFMVPGGGGGTFAGGPGTGGALVPSNGSIPLNYTSFSARPSSSDAATAAVGFGTVGAGLLGTVHAITEVGVEMGHLQAILRGIGFTQEQSDRARTIGLAEQRRTPGITASSAVEIISDLGTLTQRPEAALNPDIVQSFAESDVVLSSVGKGDARKQLFRAMQAGELRGVLHEDAAGNIPLDTLQAFLRNVTTTTLVTGGRVGPTEILQLIKSGGLGAASMTDRSLFADAITPILSMGAARAGTGIQAFAQQFSAGKMSDAGIHLLQEMNLLNMDKVPTAYRMVGRGKNRHEEVDPDQLRQYRSGIGQYRLPPEVLRGFDQARDKPFEYMLGVLLPAIDKNNDDRLGPARDAADQMGRRMASAAAITSRLPAGSVLGDVIRNSALLDRDREGIAKGNERDAFANAQTDPRVKMLALSAGLSGLLTALSGPVMDTAIGGVNKITDALNAVSAWAEKHPATAGRVVELAGTLGALSVAIAAAASALFVAGPMIRVAQWALGSGAAAAAMAGGGVQAGAGAAAATGGSLLSRLAGRVLAPIGLGMAAWDAAKSTGSVFDDIGDTLSGRMPRSLAPRAGVAPTTPSNMNVQMQGKLVVDGKEMGSMVANGIARSGAGPNTGTTGFDLRTGVGAGLAAIP